MDKKEILDEIEDRIMVLEGIMVSVSDIGDRNIVEGKVRALKLIKEEVGILDMDPSELATILENKFENGELGIEGKYRREGFEDIISEYIGKAK
ncbi:MAG: hypothetical protein ACRDD2_01820 [Sarcina sp.]